MKQFVHMEDCGAVHPVALYNRIVRNILKNNPFLENSPSSKDTSVQTYRLISGGHLDVNYVIIYARVYDDVNLRKDLCRS